MKQNESGMYELTKGEPFIVDPDTGKKQLFLIDSQKKIVIRSMLENDIDIFISKMDMTSSEKRKKKRLLYEELPKQNSEFYFFAVERIVDEIEDSEPWYEVYGHDRIPIGIGAREQPNSIIDKKSEKEIELLVLASETKHSSKVLELLKELAKTLGIEGRTYMEPNRKWN